MKIGVDIHQERIKSRVLPGLTLIKARFYRGLNKTFLSNYLHKNYSYIDLSSIIVNITVAGKLSKNRYKRYQ